MKGRDLSRFLHCRRQPVARPPRGDDQCRAELVEVEHGQRPPKPRDSSGEGKVARMIKKVVPVAALSKDSLLSAR
jgi:hypothetical protein